MATSIHLVCRPRPQDAGIGDWGDVFRELPKRVGDWMERLQGEGIRGADLVFACIGPALEIYSRYSKVVDAEEREIPLGGDPEATEPHKRGYLAYVWEVVGRTALEHVLGTAEARARNGAAGALEEDARLTALFLWAIQATETSGGRRRGGPCLNYIAVQMEHGNPDALGLMCVYRNHDFLERAYGNYWGLCNLLCFVAEETDSAPGPLTCVSSRAHVENKKSTLNAFLDRLP